MQQTMHALPRYQLTALALMLAIVIVEARLPRPRVWSYLLAVTIAAAIAVAAAILWETEVDRSVSPTVANYPGAGPYQPAVLFGFFWASNVLIHGWIVTLVYVRFRGARLAARALADAELARTRAAHSATEDDLHAAEVEVDPAVVFRALEAIETAYERDPRAADAMMDELIAFLRAAIPKLRVDALARPSPAGPAHGD